MTATEQPQFPMTFERRRFLQRLCIISVGAPSLVRTAAGARVNPPAMIEVEEGHYRFLPAGQVFCGGVLPDPGYEAVHAILRPNLPLSQGYTWIENYLKEVGLPVQALCGMEPRVPAPMSVEAFRNFNAPYMEQLRKWNLMVGSYSAVCRTTVAPGLNAPKEASLHAFSYVAPARRKGSTFCVSGTADIDPKGKIVAEADISAVGMTQKLKFVMDVIANRLAELDLSWNDVAQADLYAVADLHNLWGTTILPGLGSAASSGVRLHYARPPIVGSEVELEVRTVAQELVLGT